MKFNEIFESTVAGSIATVAKPLGEIETRVEKPPKSPTVKKNKKKYANQISEGAMKALAYNLKHMNADEFQKVYNKTKEFFTKPSTPAVAPKPSPSTKTGSKVWHDTGYTDKNAAKQTDEPIKEDELKEDDLIVLPGMRRMKDTSFIPHKADRRDHEVEMARSDLYAAAKDAMRIFKLLKDRSEDEGLMGWQQSYITLAADYLNSVADSIEYNAKVKGSLDEMTGGVLAGGMSNFEESTQRVDSLVTDALKIMKSPEIEDAVKALKTVLGDREYNSRRDFYKFFIKQLVDMYGKQGVAEGKCPKCGGPAFSEESIAEAKDACYHKVKSRYKVWPSAYASGALVKCRKVGASNWGNKSK